MAATQLLVSILISVILPLCPTLRQMAIPQTLTSAALTKASPRDLSLPKSDGGSILIAVCFCDWSLLYSGDGYSACQYSESSVGSCWKVEPRSWKTEFFHWFIGYCTYANVVWTLCACSLYICLNQYLNSLLSIWATASAENVFCGEGAP